MAECIKIGIIIFLIGFLPSSVYVDSTVPTPTSNSDTDFSAATFADKYRGIIPEGGKRVSVLIKLAGEAESIDPAKRAKEIRYLQSYVLKFLSYTNGVNVISNQERNEITAQIHPVWIKILEERNDVLSVTILDDLAPKKQQSLGKTIDEISCKEGLVLMEKYNGSPACVSAYALSKLVERGWGRLL